MTSKEREEIACEPKDIAALTEFQQEQLDLYKTETRIKNQKYLRQHPEIESLISHFLREVLLERPESIREFAAEFFSNKDIMLKVKGETQSKLSDIKAAQ